MSPLELQQYIHERIPLSKAMAITVISVAKDTVILQAPLGPNINHRDTVFGGSAAALAILAGWALLHVRLHAEGIASRLVIQRNTMEYQQPIRGPFTARSTLERADRWQQFTAMLARKGRARATVSAVLEHSGQVVGSFSGEFVALGAKTGTPSSGADRRLGLR
jgi:thioesterase domain-containing protein